ncbi:MAG: TonB-dependent receptor [Bryobacteraceae bacterium]|nr:TonB-dependent receptor [Bryobacteraceae bacterium]
MNLKPMRLSLHPARRRACALWMLPILLLMPARGVEPGADPQGDQPSPAALKTLSIEQLAQLEVTTVAKERRPAFRTPAAVFVITREDIRRSGINNLPNLLRLAPGVEVAQIDSVKWAIGIRGFQGRLSRAVLVLIDGRTVYTPLFAGVYWEVQDTLIEDIERIEVVRGPGGTVWGSNAVNGVINIITRNAKDTRGALITAGGGNVEQGTLKWRYGAGSDKLAFRVFGKGYTRGPQFHSDGRNFDDSRRGHLGFRLDWDTSERDAVTLQGDAYGMIAGQNLNISTFSPPAFSRLDANAYLYGQNLLGGWRRTLRSGSSIEVRAFFDRTDRQDLNFREVRNTYDVDLVYRIPTARHIFTWGGGARVSPARFFQVVETVNFIPHEQTYNLFSGFLEDEIALIPDRLAFTVGAKLEHNSFSGFEIQPSGQLAWTPNERNTIWAAITRAVRTPSRVEDGFSFSALAEPSIPLYLRLVGDGEFTPEQFLGTELGYRRYFARSGFISVATFYNWHDDLLSVESRPFMAETSPPPPRLVLPLLLRNGVQARTGGAEVATLWDLRPWWRVSGSYSSLLLNARNKPFSNDASTVRQLEGDTPIHKVVAVSSFTLPGNGEIDLFFRHVSAVPNQRVPAYSTGDARFGWRLTPRLELSIVGRNLLQPYHFEYGGNPGPLVGIRRAVFGRLTWSE